MNNQFDELTKSLAQSVTRRQAFKKFGLGLAGMALACFGLADKAGAARPKGPHGYCAVGGSLFGNPFYTGGCIDPKGCFRGTSADCPSGTLAAPPFKLECGSRVSTMPCSFPA
jgi:hypothetical protein